MIVNDLSALQCIHVVLNCSSRLTYFMKHGNMIGQFFMIKICKLLVAPINIKWL